MKRCIIYILIVYFLCACGQSKRTDVQKIIRIWQGKEILIPSETNFKIFGKDTLCSDLWNKPYRIFTYIDSVGCTSCQLGLPEWKSLIDSCRQQQIDAGFIFAVHSSDFRRFTGEVKFHDFDYPLIYDAYNRFDKLNHFPPAPYRTFLLDKDNKILLVGSPVNNPHMWELYKKTITQSK